MQILRNILILLILSACSSSESGTSHSFQIYEENGITIAETSGGPKYEGELFTYQQVGKLFENPENPESLLFRPSTLYLLNKDGCYYVADNGNCRIAVFGPDGRFLRSFGREGNGPGEFRSVRIQYLWGDTLSLWDYLSRRATLYRNDGTLIDVLTPLYTRRLNGIHRDQEGYLYYFNFFGTEREGYQFNGNGVVIYSAEGDTVADIRTPEMREAFTWRTDNYSGTGPLPFAGETEIQLLADGSILRSTGQEPVIEFVDRAGDLQREIRLDLIRERISDRERRALRDSLATSDWETTFTLQEFKAFWSTLFQDSHGYFWLQYPRSYYRLTPTEGRRYRVLNPKGEYLGDTVLPNPYGRIYHGKYLTWIFDDETGERSGVIYQISPAVEGLIYP